MLHKVVRIICRCKMKGDGESVMVGVWVIMFESGAICMTNTMQFCCNTPVHIQLRHSSIKRLLTCSRTGTGIQCTSDKQSHKDILTICLAYCHICCCSPAFEQMQHVLWQMHTRRCICVYTGLSLEYDDVEEFGLARGGCRQQTAPSICADLDGW